MCRALVLAVFALAHLGFGCESAPAEKLGRTQQATIDDGAADQKFGQPDFTSHTMPASPNFDTAQAPVGIATDPSFTAIATPPLWMIDREAHRAIQLQPASLTAIRMIGQSSWTVGAPNGGLGVVGKTGFSSPTAIAVGGTVTTSGSALLAVADTGNHRVLVGAGIGAWNPAIVLGQHDSFTTANRNDGGIGSGSLAEPSGVAFDTVTPNPDLYVADTGNNRVLVFTYPDSIASDVLGQKDFSSGEPNRGGAPAADTLNGPTGIATWNDLGDLYGFYVADTGNHRVLHFRVGVKKADLVYGQPDFTSAIPSNGGVSANSLRNPTAVALDPSGGLYVADTGHHRVLHYPKGKTTADKVFGQPDFTSSMASPAVSASTLRAPSGVAVLANGNLVVADTSNSRLLEYSKGCGEGCDDGDPCTNDFCDPVSGCVHRTVVFSSACAPYRCDGVSKTCVKTCSNGSDCAAPAQCRNGRCVTSCSSAVQCESGFCVDGVCCDRACDGPCERCALAGFEGKCVVAAAGPPPAGRFCPTTVDGECGTRCNGLDGKSCSLAPKGSSCGVAACVDGEQRSPGRCDGAGACVSKVASCAPYACGASGCRTSCLFDYECTGAARCVDGACVVGYGAEGGGGGCDFGRGTRATSAFALALVGCAIVARRRR